MRRRLLLMLCVLLTASLAWAQQSHTSSYTQIRDAFVQGSQTQPELGTVERPFKIENLADLQKLSELTNSGLLVQAASEGYNLHFQQTADIDGQGGDFVAIGYRNNPFCGMYDGYNYTIKNLRISGGDVLKGIKPGVAQGVGLFGVVRGGQISNVRLESIDLPHRRNGAIAKGALIGHIALGLPEHSSAHMYGVLVSNCHVVGVQIDNRQGKGVDGKDRDNNMEFAHAGGLIGYIGIYQGAQSTGERVSVINCTAFSPDSEENIIYTHGCGGGLVGGIDVYVDGSKGYLPLYIGQCYAQSFSISGRDGDVSGYYDYAFRGKESAGGLIGRISTRTLDEMPDYYRIKIENCAATLTLLEQFRDKGEQLGSLIGLMGDGVFMKDCYSINVRAGNLSKHKKGGDLNHALWLFHPRSKSTPHEKCTIENSVMFLSSIYWGKIYTAVRDVQSLTNPYGNPYMTGTLHTQSFDDFKQRIKHPAYTQGTGEMHAPQDYITATTTRRLDFMWPETDAFLSLWFMEGDHYVPMPYPGKDQPVNCRIRPGRGTPNDFRYAIGTNECEFDKVEGDIENVYALKYWSNNIALVSIFEHPGLKIEVKNRLTSSTDTPSVYIDYYHTQDPGKDVELPAQLSFTGFTALHFSDSDYYTLWSCDAIYTNGEEHWVDVDDRYYSDQENYIVAVWPQHSKATVRVTVQPKKRNVEYSALPTTVSGSSVVVTPTFGAKPSGELQSGKSASLGWWGTSAEVSINAPDGYEVDAVLVDGKTVEYEKGKSFKVESPKEDKTVKLVVSYRKGETEDDKGGSTGGETGGNTGGETGGNTGGETGGNTGGDTSGTNGGTSGGNSANAGGGTSSGSSSDGSGTSGSGDSATPVQSVQLAEVVAVPVPFRDVLTLQGVSRAVKYQVLNLQGALVAQGALQGSEQVQLATQGWRPGMYLVRLFTAEGGTRVLKVVKR